MLSGGINLLQNNVPVHAVHCSITTVEQCWHEIMPHPPYSPHVAPGHFFLFPNMKNLLHGHNFSENKTFYYQTGDKFRAQKEGYYNQGIMNVVRIGVLGAFYGFKCWWNIFCASNPS